MSSIMVYAYRLTLLIELMYMYIDLTKYVQPYIYDKPFPEQCAWLLARLHVCTTRTIM